MNNYDGERTIGVVDNSKTIGLNNNKNNKKEPDEFSLIIIDNTKVIQTKELKKDIVTIGRVADIKISSGITSKMHGRFTKYQDTYCYEDVGSYYGTFLNGVQIQQQREKPTCRFKLKDGDVIRIESNLPQYDLTESVLIIFSTQPATRNNWNYIDLNQLNQPLQIGRTVPENHLKFEGMQISRQHAIIFRNANGYVIQDTGSKNGTIVNGYILQQPHLLSNKDIICIGSNKIIYSSGLIIFNSAPTGVRLEIQNISRVVKDPKKGSKTILKNVSLNIEPSSLVAVIGGSGAGKSTFMNCINGFEPATQGKVLMNGIDLYQNYSQLKSMIGYVPQKDELHDYLNVQQTLTFTANLRLNNDISKKELANRVNNVLNIMDLSSHKNTLVKKLSGGQKKRVSIAMELVSDPDIFFLDEPTSGLDPETETALMKQLKHLSTSVGKTIVVITHTLQNIHLFDKIIFLAPGGQLCYYGKPENAPQFFGVSTLPDAYEKIKNNIDYFVNKYNRG